MKRVYWLYMNSSNLLFQTLVIFQRETLEIL